MAARMHNPSRAVPSQCLKLTEMHVPETTLDQLDGSRPEILGWQGYACNPLESVFDSGPDGWNMARCSGKSAVMMIATESASQGNTRWTTSSRPYFCCGCLPGISLRWRFRATPNLLRSLVATEGQRSTDPNNQTGRHSQKPCRQAEV